MANVIATVSSLADNDRFLPRYLSTQLIALLAKILPELSEQINAKASDQAEKFLATYKQSELFTPLTASIFWTENSAEALEQNTLPLDDLDKSNRSPLTMALVNEDFALADKLIQKGASIYLEDKLVLEIALTSMLQRDPELMNKILAQAAEHDKIWINEYFTHLSENLQGLPASNKSNRYSEVLNPTIRQFGQALDTLVYFNGIPSHYGFIAPSLDILCRQLKNSGKDLVEISQAFEFARTTCIFTGNLPNNPDAAKTMTSQISNSMRGNSFNPTILFGGWAGTCVALAFIKNHLVIADFETKIYTITNPAAITNEAIESFINGLGKATSAATILALLGDIVDAKPIYLIKHQANPVDNCIFVNPRAVIQGALLVFSSYKQNGNATAENLNAMAVRAADIYNSFVNSLYKTAINDLAKFVRNNNIIKNKRIECCSLALEYINQHYMDPEALPLCIELKNALEFVGLGAFYTRNIIPEAQDKIQAQMIRNQELTAIEVINQENALLAKQK